MYNAKVLADSIADGVRLTTMEVTFPRFILAEFNTHRMFSRNSASSRAIPVETRIAQVLSNPFIPEAFAKNQKGMQAKENIDTLANVRAKDVWLTALHDAVQAAQRLVELGVHKQHANRLLEPFCWHTVVVSSTEWDNFYNLRQDKHAQPEMQITAKLMKQAHDASVPHPMKPFEWHLPYVTPEERATHAEHALIMLSVVKCAAVSFERQEAERTFEQVTTRYLQMRDLAHWSPFEHQARMALPDDVKRYGISLAKYEGGVEMFEAPAFLGNFRWPWIQYRKTYENEAVWHAPEFFA